MFRLLYDLTLGLLALLILPKVLWQRVRYGKYRQNLAQRLGLRLPKNLNLSSTKPIIWLHAVSVGETRAAIPLFQLLKKNYPEASIFISSTTETGQAEAKRSLAGAAAYFFLPLDFSWAIKKMVEKIRPEVLILVESDFWYNLFKYAKKGGAAIVLVNGKVSERSYLAFAAGRFFSKALFDKIDCLCLQNQTYCDRFVKIGVEPSKIKITGNLKFDIDLPRLSPAEIDFWRQDLGLSQSDRIVVIGSTHDPEEDWLLSALGALAKIRPALKILLVPRHPERFAQVAALLQAKQIPMFKYSERYAKPDLAQAQVVLIDAMGLLPICYQLAEVAIVGGSFVAHIGGHNIFEPLVCGIPVLFGPHMHQQTELKEIVTAAGAGQQVTLSELPAALAALLNDRNLQAQRSKSAFKLAEDMRGSALKTLAALDFFLKRNLEDK